MGVLHSHTRTHRRPTKLLSIFQGEGVKVTPPANICMQHLLTLNRLEHRLLPRPRLTPIRTPFMVSDMCDVCVCVCLLGGRNIYLCDN